MKVEPEKLIQLVDYLHAHHKEWQEIEYRKDRYKNTSQNMYAMHLHVKPPKYSKIMTLQEAPSQVDVDNMARVLNQDRKGEGDKIYELLGLPHRITDKKQARFIKLWNSLNADDQHIIEEMLERYETMETEGDNKSRQSSDSFEAA